MNTNEPPDNDDQDATPQIPLDIRLRLFENQALDALTAIQKKCDRATGGTGNMPASEAGHIVEACALWLGRMKAFEGEVPLSEMSALWRTLGQSFAIWHRYFTGKLDQGEHGAN